MSSCTAMQAAERQNVGMGQIAVAKGPALLCSVLGSCVGLTLFHPRLKIGALAHIVLPTASGRGALPGKFADTAVPHMLEQFAQAGVPRHGLVAKIAGGACMFGVNGPLQIGDSNIDAVQTLLTNEKIRIAAKDVGGQKGRRVTLDCATGELLVEIAGNAKITL